MAVRSLTSRIAHVLERIGLALAGASCGLFVAVHAAQLGVDIFAAPASIFAMTVYGAIGFYLGIDIPPHAALADKPDPVELLSAVGTFLAAVAAFLSVFFILLDVVPPTVWTIVIWACWLVGVTLQVVAGAVARVRAL